MGKINVIFGTHNSLPYGSPDAVFENAYQKDYKPFLTELYNNPELFTIIHYSGIVLDWLKDHHPEFLMLLNDMVKRKQVELLGGGFYDPFLPLIPHTDRLGQVESLTTLIRERFGKRPRGGWITENIWDPALVSMLKNSGLDYIFLEEYHFINAGLSEKDLYNPVMTEDQGKVITVYPIASKISERM